MNTGFKGFLHFWRNNSASFSQILTNTVWKKKKLRPSLTFPRILDFQSWKNLKVQNVSQSFSSPWSDENRGFEFRQDWVQIPNLGFPDGSDSKESASNAGDPDSIPGSGISPEEAIGYPLQYSWASLVAQLVKNPPAMWETWVRSLGWEDSPGERKGYPLQYSGLEISMDCIDSLGRKESDTTERPSLHFKHKGWWLISPARFNSWVIASACPLLSGLYFHNTHFQGNVVNDGVKLEVTGSIQTQVKKIVKDPLVSIIKFVRWF